MIEKVENRPILELVNVTKSFVKEQKLFENINISINKSQIITLTGKNGSGKSTLLKIIAGLDNDYIGTIKYNGNNHTVACSDIMYIHQSYEQLFPWLTVVQNIISPIILAGLATRHEAVERAYSVLKTVGIDETEFNRYPCELSGGQKQRVAIARGLALEANILLMDEPFSAIDESSKPSLRMLLLDIAKRDEKTIIIVSHSSEDVDCLADRIICLNKQNL